MDDITAAKTLISCLDLTSLNDKDNEVSIDELCKKAVTPWGNVAAICVFPFFVGQVFQQISGSNIKIATVVNFPQGGKDWQKMNAEIKRSLAIGADEIDAVFPYQAFLQGDYKSCAQFLSIVREETAGHVLKIIIESGALQKPRLIKQVSEMCIIAGVDFIKTSTGKTDVSATPEAANIMLETIASCNKEVGFKASGGIKTLVDAKKYLTLAQSILGPQWIKPEHFRIGASSLLDDLQESIKRGY